VIIINEGALVKEGQIKTLMMGEKNVFKLRVRGSQQGIENFRKELEKIFNILSTEDEEGQQSLVIKGTKSGKKLFELASETGIQIREFGPATLSLEDIFLGAFKGGD
jgi:ABC-type multidrug transport system ATPase subunit